MSEVNISKIAQSIKENVSKVIIGKDDIIEKIIISCFCSGHILLEDIPGTGKTTAAKAFAKSVSCDFKRVQFTPDLLPSDITGINFYNQKNEEFTFKAGPVFTNILLADEINRATPRTQSSLLECMEERQVTIDGQTYKLDAPFLVIATQNPIETQGTFPLPEAQLDRFFMKLSMGYPDVASEVSILTNTAKVHPVNTLESVVSKEDVIAAQEAVKEIAVSDEVKEYIVRIVNATRTDKNIKLGVSPRGSLALFKAAQCKAGIEGRDYVLPDDVKAVSVDVLAHRIICKGNNLLKESNSSAQVFKNLLDTVEVPIA